MTQDRSPGFYSAQISDARRFHLELEPPRATPLAVVAGGRENCAPNYEIHRPSFPFWGLEFVAQGHGTVAFGAQRLAILPGSLFGYGPATPHDILTDARNPLVKYFVDFTGTRAATLLPRHGLHPGTVIQTSAPGEIMAILDDLIRTGLHYTPFSGRIAAVILEHLLLKIAETSIPNGSAATPAFATYRRCRQHLQDHWRGLHSLGDIAAACHVDPAYLCRLFQRFDRQSPYQVLLRLKITHAAERLRAGDLAVARLAEELHFADPFHFSRVFKKLMGISPSHFTRLSGR